MATAEPADAPAHREADHADVGRRAAQRGEPVLARGGAQLAAEDTRLHARPARAGIDRHPAHPVRLQQHHAVQRAERARGVAAALRRHAQPALAREVHDRGHVVGTVGVGDRGGLLVGEQVPGLAGGVPAVVAGPEHGGADG